MNTRQAKLVLPLKNLGFTVLAGWLEPVETLLYIIANSPRAKVIKTANDTVIEVFDGVGSATNDLLKIIAGNTEKEYKQKIAEWDHFVRDMLDRDFGPVPMNREQKPQRGGGPLALPLFAGV